MYSDKEILARLQRGEKAEDIAKEMTSLLNSAIDQKKKSDEENANKKRSSALKHLETAATEINTYLHDCYPEEYDNGIKMTTDDLKDIISTIIDTDQMCEELKSFISKVFRSSNQKPDPIARFLKSYGL